MGAVGSSRVMCDNVPGLVSRQRQLCQRHPEAMRAVGRGVAEWTAECQHQFRQHRWNCNTLPRDRSLFGRVLLRSKYPAARGAAGRRPGPGSPCAAPAARPAGGTRESPLGEQAGSCPWRAAE
ncbi:hypothetical protein KIL84_018152 [Mauremys mutica]|uniref:Protein Wnt n=1 Tax=Mauremys mutica TaxID=74926 RepID=A0A9D3XSP5_9SAUR|nr:hypothetical protein KIL84_018152 [Mauremys mutica]